MFSLSCIEFINNLKLFLFPRPPPLLLFLLLFTFQEVYYGFFKTL